MMRETTAAADRLEAEGVSVEVIDLQSLVPIDADCLVASARKTGRVVVIHEAPSTGGFGGEVAARIQEQALFYLRAPVLRVTGWDVVVPLRQAEHHYLPSVERILSAAYTVLED